MKVFLLNHNPVVSRLAKLSLEKIGYELEEIASITQISGKCADIFICDSELIDPDVDYSPYGKELLFLVPRDFEKKVGKNMLEKPFLPTDFAECVQKIVSKKDEKTIEDEKPVSKENFADITNKTNESSSEISLDKDSQEVIIPELDEMDEIKLDDVPEQNTPKFSTQNSDDEGFNLNDSSTLINEEKDDVFKIDDIVDNSQKEQEKEQEKEKELNELSLMVDEIDNLSPKNSEAKNIVPDLDSANDEYISKNTDTLSIESAQNFENEVPKLNDQLDIKLDDSLKISEKTDDLEQVAENKENTEKIALNSENIDEIALNKENDIDTLNDENNDKKSVSDQGQYQMFGNSMFNAQNEPTKTEILDTEILKDEVKDESKKDEILKDDTESKPVKDEILKDYIAENEPIKNEISDTELLQDNTENDLGKTEILDTEILKDDIIKNDDTDFKIMDEYNKKDEILQTKNEPVKTSQDDSSDFKIINDDEYDALKPKNNTNRANKMNFDSLDDEFLGLAEKDLASALGESIPEPEISKAEPKIAESENLKAEPEIVAEPENLKTEPEITEAEITKAEITEPEITEAEITKAEPSKPELLHKVIRLRAEDDPAPKRAKPKLEIEPKILKIHPEDLDEFEAARLKFMAKNALKSISQQADNTNEINEQAQANLNDDISAPVGENLQLEQATSENSQSEQAISENLQLDKATSENLQIEQADNTNEINEQAQANLNDDISALDEAASVYENAIKQDQDATSEDAIDENINKSENTISQDVLSLDENIKKDENKRSGFASKIKAKKALDSKELDFAADIYEKAANEAEQNANEKALNEAKEEISTKLNETLGATLANSTIKEALKDLNIKINISFEDK